MGQVIQCYFCGNKTYMNEVASHRYDDAIFESGEEYPDYFSTTFWKMFFCPVCNKVTLMKFYSDSIITGPGGDEIQSQA